MKKFIRTRLGVRQALEYILDLLCYAYYVKADNLVSDKTFDELERIYCVLTNSTEAPNRGNEGSGTTYSYGVQFLYEELNKRRFTAKKKLLVDEGRG